MSHKNNNHTTIQLSESQSSLPYSTIILVGDAYYTNYQQEITTHLIRPMTAKTYYLAISNGKCEALEFMALGYRRIGTNT